jgi:hypothetical protein
VTRAYRGDERPTALARPRAGEVQTERPSKADPGLLAASALRGADMLQLQRVAGNQAAVSMVARQGQWRPVAVQRTRDSQLDARLEALQQLAAMPYSEEGLYAEVVARVRGIDLTDSDNLVPVTKTVGDILPPGRLQHFLASVDRPARRAGPTVHDPSRVIRDFSNPRRGPYGLRGPGVVLPVAAEMVRPLAEPLINAMSTVQGFVDGLYRGVSSSVSPGAAEELAERMLESSILNVVFAPVFLAGTAVGIGSDAIETVRGAYGLIVNFDEIVAQATAVLEISVSPDGNEFGRIIGEEIGRGWGRDLVRLSKEGVFTFTYEIGKIAGPAIVYTICSFLGLPQLAAGAVFARLSTRLLPVLRRFPRLAALAESVARRLRRSPHTAGLPGAPDHPRPRGYTAEGMGDAFTHGPLPEVPDHIPTGRGRRPLGSETDKLTSYADARRPQPDEPYAKSHPATSAARDRASGGVHIRDNLYTGKAQSAVTQNLIRHGILKVSPGGMVRVLDADRYMTWLERAYRHHGGSHLDPRMAKAIRRYVGGGVDIPVEGMNPHSGRKSFAGSLPGTHAELLAVNDVLVGGAERGVKVATVRAQTGGHFAACLHCRGVLRQLTRSTPGLGVLTGVVTPKP